MCPLDKRKFIYFMIAVRLLCVLLLSVFHLSFSALPVSLACVGPSLEAHFSIVVPLIYSVVSIDSAMSE